MTATLVDPFAEERPLRDKPHKRPLLIPKTGGERIAYTRMSTLADFICTKQGLTIYQRRLIALGLGLREDLCAMLAALPPLNDLKADKSTLTKEQLAQDAATKKKIDEYIEQALEAAGATYKANWGTAVHQFIENGSAERAPERMRGDVESALEAFERIGAEVLCSEVFVANDALTAAGSLDHLVHIPRDGWGVVIVDVKTGQAAKDKALQFAVQLSGYVNGEVYDVYDDTRAPLESLTGGLRINRNVGLVAHVPLGASRTSFKRINLMTGVHAARLATQVRTARSLDLMTEASFE